MKQLPALARFAIMFCSIFVFCIQVCRAETKDVTMFVDNKFIEEFGKITPSPSINVTISNKKSNKNEASIGPWLMNPPRMISRSQDYNFTIHNPFYGESVEKRLFAFYIYSIDGTRWNNYHTLEEPIQLRNLWIGTHRLSIQAIDVDGVWSDKVTYSWIVDPEAAPAPLSDASSHAMLLYDDTQELQDYHYLGDYWGQDGSYGYIHFSTNYTNAYTDTYTAAQNNITGLQWYGGIWGTWQEAVDNCNMLNSLDNTASWRLPTVHELIEELVFNQLQITDAPTWSETTPGAESSMAWGVNNATGTTGLGDKSGKAWGGCVQGSRREQDFTNGTLTAIDNSTHLMWTKTAQQSVNWKDALAYCRDLELEGFTDWRLPDIKELESLVVYGNTPTYDEIFTVSGDTIVWSGTSLCDPYSPVGARTIDFSSGKGNASVKSNTHNAFCVRGGDASRMLPYPRYGGNFNDVGLNEINPNGPWYYTTTKTISWTKQDEPDDTYLDIYLSSDNLTNLTPMDFNEVMSNSWRLIGSHIPQTNSTLDVLPSQYEISGQGKRLLFVVSTGSRTYTQPFNIIKPISSSINFVLLEPAP
ncbi:MAG: DUF1566 domain-containing protein [Solidesulfovibrio sp. DCME]|uniref:Lcl domain-containing protein n=1 Tax=Solidesulfovibrio sp. DCME TaxID=3447380 RepID=UPI003D1352FC